MVDPRSGPAPEPEAGARPAPPVVDVDVHSLAALAGSVAVVVVTLGLARSVPRSLAAVAIAALLALGLNPAVSAVERRLRLPRMAAMAGVLILFAAAWVGLGFALVPSAVRQISGLEEDVPRAVAQLADLPFVGAQIERAHLQDRVERVLNDLPNRLLGQGTPLIDLGKRAIDTAVAGTTTALLALTLLLDGRRLAGHAARLVPRNRRRQAERLGDLAYRAVGRYVAGSLSVAVVAGVFTLGLGLVVGVPLAPVLALWVMVWDLVPQIGGAAGGIPFVAFAFTQGALPGLICAALFVLYLQIENNVLGPLLVGSAVKLSPPATMVAALVGVSAGGVVGALLAVPIVGAAKAVYLEVRPPPDVTADP